MAALAGLALAVLASGCRSMYSHTNKRLPEGPPIPSHASFDIRDRRGADNVLVVMALSGGGSRAAYFASASMLRLETVLDDLNVLKEVDVMSGVSGGSVAAAYYCVSRDPGDYQSVRLRQPLGALPDGFGERAKLGADGRQLYFRRRMSAREHALLAAQATDPRDRRQIDRLRWLSRNAGGHRPWQAGAVRNLMSRNYVARLAGEAFLPNHFVPYWFTGYDRSDIMANVLSRNLFSSGLIELQPAFDAVLDALPGGGRPSGEGAETGPQPGQLPGLRQAHGLASGLGAGILGTIDKASRRVTPPRHLKFRHLNPERPYLIINATNATANSEENKLFGNVFTFTQEDFSEHLNSDIGSYSLGRAVMASAAFPGAFNYMTLRDFRPQHGRRKRYMHVFDGGNADNLGLNSAKRVILQNHAGYDKVIVILVDAHIESVGVPADRPDVRNFLLDLNFLSTFDTLLDAARVRQVEEFRSGRLNGQELGDKLLFWHITFEDLESDALRRGIYGIPTNFRISEEDTGQLDQAAAALIRPEHEKLREIRRILLDQ